MTKPFRFGVQVSAATSARRAGATRRASSRTSGTRRCSCPTTSATRSSRRCSAIAMAAAHTDDAARRRARVRQRLQAPGDPRQGGGDDRPALRRPARARHRRGLDEDRLRRARPAVRPARRARRPVRGGAARHQAVLRRRAVQLHGEHYRSPTTTASPKPVQQPRPPILIGGGGKRVLSLAAREADIVGINPNLRAGAVTADAATTRSPRRPTRRSAGSARARATRFDDIEIQIRFFFAAVTDDRTALAERDRARLRPDARGGARVGHRARRHDRRDHASSSSPRRERWGLSYVVVGDDNVDEFAPVVARLAGT